MSGLERDSEMGDGLPICSLVAGIRETRARIMVRWMWVGTGGRAKAEDVREAFLETWEA